MIAWLAVVLGINIALVMQEISLSFALLKLLPALLVLLIPNTTSDHAIIYTNTIASFFKVKISDFQTRFHDE